MRKQVSAQIALLLMVTGIMGFLVSAVAGETPYAAACRAGQDYEKAGKFAEARAEYEKALATEGITPEQSGEALLTLAAGYCREYKWQPATIALQKALALKGVSDAVKIKAYMADGKIGMNYGDWARVKTAYAEALKLPGLSPEQKVLSQKAMVKALVNLRQYADARALMQELLAYETVPAGPEGQEAPRVVLQEFTPTTTLPKAEKTAIQMAIGKTLMAEQNFAAARAEFSKALALPDISNEQKAESQLYIGLSYYEAKDYERAQPELTKVLSMPGAGTRPPWDGGRMGYVPAREAMLRLRFRQLVPDDKNVLKVLFIGSSHTLRGNIPELVTQLAASAPTDQPRILAGDFVRMGTGLNTFWEAGDTPDTARGVIAADPWDAVVFETFYNMNGDVMAKYGTLIADLIRRQKAKPVIYESPIPQAAAYPDKFQKFHDDNVALVKSLKVPVAPSVAAWMRYLGPKPTPEQFNVVYADWIHASPKGVYITACCIYSALTGFSPMGLYHPSDISDIEAKAFQEIAWATFQETNPDMKR